MIRVSRLADYGIVVLAQMARSGPGEVHAARDLARKSGVPAPMASKVLKALCRAHVVNSRRGMAGGYELAKEPHRITMAEVIEALEGPVAITECAGGGCILESRCVVRGNWGALSGAIQDLLKRVSLQDMLHPGGVLQRTALRPEAAGHGGAA